MSERTSKQNNQLFNNNSNTHTQTRKYFLRKKKRKEKEPQATNIKKIYYFINIFYLFNQVMLT